MLSSRAIAPVDNSSFDEITIQPYQVDLCEDHLSCIMKALTDLSALDGAARSKFALSILAYVTKLVLDLVGDSRKEGKEAQNITSMWYFVMNHLADANDIVFQLYHFSLPGAFLGLEDLLGKP